MLCVAKVIFYDERFILTIGDSARDDYCVEEEEGRSDGCFD